MSTLNRTEQKLNRIIARAVGRAFAGIHALRRVTLFLRKKGDLVIRIREELEEYDFQLSRLLDIAYDSDGGTVIFTRASEENAKDNHPNTFAEFLQEMGKLQLLLDEL